MLLIILHNPPSVKAFPHFCIYHHRKAEFLIVCCANAHIYRLILCKITKLMLLSFVIRHGSLCNNIHPNPYKKRVATIFSTTPRFLIIVYLFQIYRMKRIATVHLLGRGTAIPFPAPLNCRFGGNIAQIESIVIAYFSIGKGHKQTPGLNPAPQSTISSNFFLI